MNHKSMSKNGVLVCIKLAIVFLFWSFAGMIGMGIIAPKIFGIDLYQSSTLSSEQKFVMLAAGAVLTTLVIFSFRTFVDKKPIASLGLIGKRRDKMLIAGFGFGALSQIIIFLLLLLLGGYELTSISYPYPALVLAFLVALIVAWQEELFFRAYVIDNFKMFGFSNRFAIVASALIFAIPHISGFGFANPAVYISIFIFGILAGLAYLKSQSIFMSLGFHMGFNSIEDVLFTSDLVKGELLYTGLRFELLDWIALAIVGFLLIKFLKYMCRKESAAKEQKPRDFVEATQR
jgi:membrane protease YdiL (CAAX protease family)